MAIREGTRHWQGETPEIPQEQDARISVLESFSAVERKRIDNLYKELSEFSQDMKDKLNNHEVKIAEHGLDAVKKQKDMDYLVKYVNGIQTIIRWSGSTLFVLLAGFFVWYVQNIGH